MCSLPDGIKCDLFTVGAAEMAVNEVMNFSGCGCIGLLIERFNADDIT